MHRYLALLLNTVLPGSGLLLRHPGLILLVLVLFGAVGLSLMAVALAAPGSAAILPVGWGGLSVWMAAAIAASIAWAVLERSSSRNLLAIQPLFREVAQAYLTSDLATAEHSARRLVALAGAEPGAWRLLALVSRAQGRDARAAKLERTAARLDIARPQGAL